MALTHNKNSPYYETPQTSWYLSNLVYRSIPSDSTDYALTLDTKYDEKPGLLAYDLFGDQRLFWVFSVMNRDQIVDPIFDVKGGMTINIPTSDRLSALLG